MAAVDSFYLLYREIARSCNCYMEALALVGAWYTARKSITVVCDFYSLIRLHFIPRLGSRADLIKQYGRWAIVSGATDGIGKAYAEELASRGLNIILISRNEEKLQNVAKNIADTYRVETDVIVADFSRGREIYHLIQEAVKDRDIGILAYLDHFSRALQYEYAAKGIFVQSLIPFCVATNTTAPRSFLHRCSWLVPSPKVYAHHAVSTLGISKRTTGYWSHSIQFLFAQYMPEWLWVWGANILNRSLRKEALSCTDESG